MEYSIPEKNMESLEKKLNRIKNKCAKYGCDFRYEKIGEHYEEVTFNDESSFDETHFGCERTYWKETVKFIDIEVEGNAIVNGWKYAASLEYTDKGNIINGINEVIIPARYYFCEPYCEHCKTSRDRKYSYIVFNEETGEYKQVGRSCLRDFTGGFSAEEAALCESWFKELEQQSEFHPTYGRDKQYFEVNNFMVFLAETIRCFGYFKRDGYNVGTADRAEELYRAACHRKLAKWEEERVKEAEKRGFNPDNPASVELAEQVREWILNNERNDNYFHNLKVACALEFCSCNETGLLASAFPAHNRELEYEAERRAREAKEAEARAKSSWMGEIGERIKFVIADYYLVSSWETQWGTTSVFKFTSTDGREATWKTGNWYEAEDVIGKTITGTIKELKEFRGVKQTELTRCKVA